MSQTSANNLSMTSPKIAIIGAGPAGCMLARLLTLASIDVTVFEGERSADYRSQGGTLDLHDETGLAAMKAAGLQDDFLKYARYDGESLKITDKDLKVYLARGGSKAGDLAALKLSGNRPEIDRVRLRQILTECLPKDIIKWNHHLKSVREDGSLEFANQPSPFSRFDLVVGAEGAWSKVRSQRLCTTIQPEFSGVNAHELHLLDAERTCPEIYKFVNRGSVFASADGQRASLQQLGDGSINIYLNFRTDQARYEQACGYDVTNIDAVKRAMVGEGGRFADWHPLVREAISKASGTTHLRPLFQLPVGFSWEHQKGFTAIGDAAHVMTPFAGEGVNVALDDAMRLAKAIIAASKDTDRPATLDEAVAGFEQEMFERVERVTGFTLQRLQTWFFRENVPRAVMAETAASTLKFDKPWFLHPLIDAIVYPVFAIKMLFI